MIHQCKFLGRVHLILSILDQVYYLKHQEYFDTYIAFKTSENQKKNLKHLGTSVSIIGSRETIHHYLL